MATLALVLGCTADTKEPIADTDTDMDMEPGPEPEPTTEASGDIPSFDCDISDLFAQRCDGGTCHGAGTSPAADLDLLSPNVEHRVSGAPGTTCNGIIADPANPRASLLYTKVTEPVCGVLMPTGREPLDAGEVSCIESWISGLLPPGGDCEDCECEPGVVEACYAGPEGTANVGMCKSGTHTCQTSGMGWLECVGEITPRGEDCFTPDVDEDCDGETPACTEVWARLFGDPDDQAMRSVAVDHDTGNIYSFGDFEGVVSFGGDPLIAALSVPPKQDLVIAKHDLYGNPIWSRGFGDSSTQIAQEMAIDDDGNLVFVGRMYGTIDLGGGTLHASGGNDIIVFKLDGAGNHVWSRIFGGNEPDRAARMAFDADGNVIITGAFTGKAEFGEYEVESWGQRDAFVAELDRNTGEPTFFMQIGAEGDDYGFGVDVDQDGDVVIAGRFGAPLELGGHMLTHAGDLDIYLARLDETGDVLWAESFGGSGKDEVHDLRLQQNGDIVLLGAISDSVDFGGGSLVSAGVRDVFLATFDDQGSHSWSVSYGDAADQFETDGTESWLSMDLDASGNIYIGGTLYGVLDFGGGEQLVANGDKSDVFHAKFDASGDYIGGRSFGGQASDYGHDLAVTESGHVLHAGRTQGSLSGTGVGALTNAGRSDGFLVKLAPL
ncbi:nucleotide-binding protein [Paraliomyxa miuraensis]|uniref:nucleotide-binding protein n=1 Tax=Paraliomyxa miuraensis TaxID=376150 RepID=UPI00225BD352|nr:nucleotide-binding protein [Paraliomyxa miuraensis]MCX4239576.1 nucleotide-binding protein [Paraliomyxa miuraensis]